MSKCTENKCNVNVFLFYICANWIKCAETHWAKTKDLTLIWCAPTTLRHLCDWFIMISRDRSAYTHAYVRGKSLCMKVCVCLCAYTHAHVSNGHCSALVQWVRGEISEGLRWHGPSFAPYTGFWTHTHTHRERTSDPSLTQPWPRLECYRSFDTHSCKQTHGSLCLHSVLLNKGERLVVGRVSRLSTITNTWRMDLWKLVKLLFSFALQVYIDSWCRFIYRIKW